MIRRLLLLLCLLAAPALAQTLTPLPGASAPTLTDVKRVRFVTTLGNFVVEVYPQAAPNASKRFLELVEQGFYDFTPVFRVVPKFVAQFGINWRGTYPEWQKKPFRDDPSFFRLERGTLAFAKAGPHTNSTQVFVNFNDNSGLVQRGGFTAFAKVVEGMDVVDRFEVPGQPEGALDQGKLWTEGSKYLRTVPQQPAYILFAEVL